MLNDFYLWNNYECRNFYQNNYQDAKVVEPTLRVSLEISEN